MRKMQQQLTAVVKNICRLSFCCEILVWKMSTKSPDLQKEARQITKSCKSGLDDKRCQLTVYHLLNLKDF